MLRLTRIHILSNEGAYNNNIHVFCTLQKCRVVLKPPVITSQTTQIRPSVAQSMNILSVIGTFLLLWPHNHLLMRSPWWLRISC